MRALLALLVAAAVVAAVFLALGSSDDDARVAAPTVTPAAGTVPSVDDPLAPVNVDGGQRAAERVERTAAMPARAGAAPTEPTEPTGRLRGSLVDALGRPVQEAEITLRFRDLWSSDRESAERPTQRATSGTSGAFELARPEADRVAFELTVRAEGFARLSRDVAGGAGDLDLGTLVLDRGVILGGRVVDAAGEPVAKAEVRREAAGDGLVLVGLSRGSLLATTDAQGRFEVSDQPVGPWSLQVVHPDHPDAWFEGETLSPDDHQVDLRFALRDGLSLEGLITGASREELSAQGEVQVSAWPVAGAGSVVRVSEARDLRREPGPRVSTVAADGRFVVRGLEPDRLYRVQASRPRADGDRTPFDAFEESVTEARVEAAGATGVELPWSLAGALEVRVVDASTGAPIEQLGVRHGGDFLMPLTNDDGRPRWSFPEGKVRIGDVRREPSAPKFRVELTAPGYEPWLGTDLEVADGKTLDLGTVALTPVASVVVTVLDDATGAPVGGAVVELRRQRQQQTGARQVRMSVGEPADEGPGPPGQTGSYRGRTDGAGHVRLSTLPGAPVELFVRARGYASSVSEAWTCPEVGDVQRTVHLAAGAMARVHVVGRDGTALADRRVEHRAPLYDPFGEDGAPGEDGGRTDGSGVATFENLEPGRHWFRIDESGPGPAGMFVMAMSNDGRPAGEGWVELDVTPGAEHSLTLQPAPRGSLAGRITEGGEQLAGARVTLRTADTSGLPAMFGDDSPNTTTSSSGGYALDDVRAGDYRVEVRHPARALPCSFDLTLDEGDNAWSIDLPINHVRGRVTDAEGKPLVGAKVRAKRVEPENRTRMSMVMLRAGGSGNSLTIGTGDMGDDDEAETDEDGRFELRGLPTDVPTQVEVRRAGFQKAKSDAFELRPGADKDGVDVALERGGALRIDVAGADLFPGALLVRATPPPGGDPQPQIAVVQDGQALLEDLAGGAWKVALQSAGPPAEGAPELPAAQTIEVVPGEEAGCHFEL